MYSLMISFTEHLKACKIITSLFRGIYMGLFRDIYRKRKKTCIGINTRFITVVTSAKEGGNVLEKGYIVGLYYI